MGLMNAGIKTLDSLVKTAIARIKALEEENAMLRKQVESYAADRTRLMKADRSPAAEEARKKLKRRLARLCEKIEKASSPQGLLFDGLEDE